MAENKNQNETVCESTLIKSVREFTQRLNTSNALTWYGKQEGD